MVAVGPYFKRFLARWPSVADLAAAPLDEVLIEWAGLGYYARARNLHKCAVTIVEHHGGCFPDSEPALLALPGIGVYTAAAIAAIAFDHPATPVDGNFERVMAGIAVPAARADVDPAWGAEAVRTARAAALADPEGDALDRAMASLKAPPKAAAAE